MILATLALLALQAPDLPRLGVGESARLELPPPGPATGPSELRCVLDPGDARRVTVELSSHDVDVLLRVEDEAGELVAQDDDSGIETDARLVLAVEEGSALVLVAAAKRGAGELTLAAHAGEPALPSGSALAEAGIEWRRVAASRARERGELNEAAIHHLVEGNLASGLRRFEEARAAFEETLALAREAGARRTEAAAFGNIAKTWYDAQDYPRARELYVEWLALAREYEDHEKEAKALLGLGNMSLYLGDYVGAEGYYDELRALSHERGDAADELYALLNLGSTHFYTGALDEARGRYEQARELAARLGRRDVEASVLQNLGTILQVRGEYAEARAAYERTLELQQELGLGGPDTELLGNLGVLELLLGDLEAAREYQRRALAAAEETGDRSGQSTAWANLGNVCFYRGEYGRARKHFDRALALAREIGDRDSEARAVGSLGLVARAVGDLDTARELLEENLAITEEMGDIADQAKAHGNLGTVHLTLDRPREALASFEREVELAREVGDPHLEAEALGNIADAYASLGDDERARAARDGQLELARRLGDRNLEAIGLSRLAQALFTAGEYERARDEAASAAAIASDIGATVREIESNQTIAVASIALRDAGTALAALEAAEEAVDRHTREGLEPGEASELRAPFALLGQAAQDLTALRFATPGVTEEERGAALAWGFAAAGRWKSRALLEGIAEHRSGARSAEAIELRKERRAALARRADALARVSDTIAAGGASEEVDRLRAEARGAQAQAERLAARLRAVSPEDAALDVPLGATPEEVRRALLGAGDLLVEYAAGARDLYAYVLGAGAPRFLVLGPREELTEEVEAFLAGIARPARLAGVAEVARRGSALHGRLLAPALAAAGEPPERLMIVPSAELAALPFEALVVEAPEATPAGFDELAFVLERYDVVYGPSSPVLLELAGAPPREDEGRLLVLADPRYPSEPGAPSPGSPAAARAAPAAEELPRLHGTRDEACAIARAVLDGEPAALAELTDARSGSFVHERLALHLGADASRARLEEDLRGCSVLHLACHGFVDADDPRRTGIALSSTADDPGFFTIADALELDLDCDLVVLSACQTARGEVRAGEGVESLARAFLYAGSRGLVASLWQVDDRAASRTMAGFYGAWMREGRTPPQALRAAKLALRRGRLELGPARGVAVGAQAGTATGAGLPGHPFYWAPFVYVGLGR